jgi:hypothetical protein
MCLSSVLTSEGNFPIPLTDDAQLRKWECLDSDTGEDLAEEVRKYHIPDFSNWKHHAAFEGAFARHSLKLRLDRPAGKRFAHFHLVAADVRSLYLFFNLRLVTSSPTTNELERGCVADQPQHAV